MRARVAALRELLGRLGCGVPACPYCSRIRELLERELEPVHLELAR